MGKTAAEWKGGIKRSGLWLLLSIAILVVLPMFLRWLVGLLHDTAPTYSALYDRGQYVFAALGIVAGYYPAQLLVKHSRGRFGHSALSVGLLAIAVAVYVDVLARPGDQNPSAMLGVQSVCIFVALAVGMGDQFCLGCAQVSGISKASEKELPV